MPDVKDIKAAVGKGDFLTLPAQFINVVLQVFLVEYLLHFKKLSSKESFSISHSTSVQRKHPCGFFLQRESKGCPSSVKSLTTVR